LVACGKALFRLGIRCRFGEDFLSASTISLKYIVARSNLCQNHTLAKIEAMPNPNKNNAKSKH
jgi:hypothetical protein